MLEYILGDWMNTFEESESNNISEIMFYLNGMPSSSLVNVYFVFFPDGPNLD